MLPSASTLLSSVVSWGCPPGFGAVLEKTVVPDVPELFLPTKDVVKSSSQTQFEAESHGGETNSPSEEETLRKVGY